VVLVVIPLEDVVYYQVKDGYPLVVVLIVVHKNLLIMVQKMVQKWCKNGKVIITLMN
jgi:hypothetical protein